MAAKGRALTQVGLRLLRAMACRTAVEGCLDEPEALPGEAPSSASSIAGAVGGTTTGEQRTLLILANDAGFPRSTLTTEAALARIGGP